MSNPLQQSPYSRGARAALDGIKIALRSNEVGKAYLRAAAVIFALTVVIDIGTIWGLWHFTTPATNAELWLVVVLWIARVIGTLGLLLIGPLLAIFTVNTAFPVFNKELFLAGLRDVDPARAAALAAKPGMGIPTAIGISLRRMLGFLLLSAALFVLGFVPVIGIVATGLQLWLTARTLAWELMDPYFDCLDIRFAEQKQFIARLHKPLLGFGFPIVLLFAIPFVGPLCFGLAQAAAATFVAREFAIDPRETAA
ncbi:MAG TPA: EI24 domain-containing protein [Enhygromyxa sp.]|nr:EI24 domain-containing protein [Enhygromyxa sp.]